MPTPFDPFQVGDLTLPDRIIMAPLTREPAGDECVLNSLMAKYYAERASAGLIIMEATSVTPQGVGYAGTPGIWSQEEVSRWKLVTEAVHAAGGRMFLQLWHVCQDPIFLNGDLAVAPSAIAPRAGARNAKAAGLIASKCTVRTAVCSTSSCRTHNPSYRRVWRFNRKSRPPPSRSNRRLHRRMGR
ncbi:2,4-dienoyl-CoA reductase-like NADH-dependent reductase (Old Yellow Enzyme family) [Paraburkholderia youngii]